MLDNRKSIGLYIHVPFCTKKCPYCDFYSIKYSATLADDYKERVLQNISTYGGNFDTVYFGGGTPILLYRQIAEILKEIKPRIAKNAEISLEANPESTSNQALKTLINSGVNRISFGVQSLCDNELSALGRAHNSTQAIDAILTASEVGFKNISADLMIGIPLQSESSFKLTLEKLVQLPIQHISAYMLKIEEGTAFDRDKPSVPHEDLTADLYSQLRDFLEENGFNQYEVSNFSKKGFECRHNLKYWLCEDYLGVGPSAHSCYNGKRFAVNPSLNEFLQIPLQQAYTTEENPRSFEEWAMLRLRLDRGIEFNELQEFGIDKKALISKVNKIPKELIEITNKGIRVTGKGFLLLNSIIENVIF